MFAGQQQQPEGLSKAERVADVNKCSHLWSGGSLSRSAFLAGVPASRFGAAKWQIKYRLHENQVAVQWGKEGEGMLINGKWV